MSRRLRPAAAAVLVAAAVVYAFGTWITFDVNPASWPGWLLARTAFLCLLFLGLGITTGKRSQ